MTRHILFYCFVLLLFMPACQRELPTTLQTEYDAAKVNAAIAHAKNEVEQFVTAFTTNDGTEFCVKAEIHDGDQSEHLWMKDLELSDGTFKGKICNDPGIVKNVTFGTAWTVAKEDITDWRFVRDGTVHGQYTAAALPDEGGKSP